MHGQQNIKIILLINIEYRQCPKYHHGKGKDKFVTSHAMRANGRSGSREWPIINALNTKLNPIRKSQLAELFCEVFKFCAWFSKKKTWLSVYTQIWHRTPFMTDSVLRHCADNKKRGLSTLQNVGHQIVHVKIAGITRRTPYSPR